MSWEDENKWRATAACIGKNDIFFSFERAEIRAAKEICGGCRHRMRCFKLATNNDEGVWGGLTQRERRNGKKPSVT